MEGEAGYAGALEQSFKVARFQYLKVFNFQVAGFGGLPRERLKVQLWCVILRGLQARRISRTSDHSALHAR